MRLTRPLTLAATCLLASGVASAQELHINEIFASHTGTDDQEYIELVGTPGMSLDGWMVVILDGDSFAAGILDRAWDLSGHTMPADGYFVMGDLAVPNMDYDLAQGPHNGGVDNNIENGTETVYLLTTTDALFIEGLHNQDLDLDDDLVTTLAQFPGTIDLKEVVGLWDDDPATTADQVFDGALELGPDIGGPWLPAGVFRPDDYPSCWCSDQWLDFFLQGLTPGTQNTSSSCNLADCGGGGGQIGTNYCGPANLNSSGMSGVISGFGSSSVADNDVELTGSQLPVNQFTMFVVSQTQGFINPPGSQGNLCVTGNIGRYKTQIQNSGTGGTVSIMADMTNVPVNPPIAAQPGDTWNFTLWFRDNNPSQTSNFTDGLSVTFN